MKQDPAFPGRSTFMGIGLTKREYFAAQVLKSKILMGQVDQSDKGLVEACYRIADEMARQGDD